VSTEAEKHYDEIMAARRKAGREKYGTGLDHTNPYDWNRMALEEAMDLSQYLAAENLRQHNWLQRLLTSAQNPVDHAAALKYIQDQMRDTMDVNKLPKEPS
jgi:hypothetical protein